jgi:phosphoribosylformimino-5-aminoimidazole carboxamide ribotide isomerase
MQIIPAIDLIDGKCVRLTEGDYAQKTEYGSSPLELAKMYEDIGIVRLHLVDLDGAKAGSVQNWKIAEQISSATSLKIDFGGGVKTREEVIRILEMGIDLVTVGSIAAKQPETFQLWLEEFGANKFLLGADVRDECIMVGGWLEKSSISLIPYLQDYYAKGIQSVFCTDVSKDGRLEGPASILYEKIKSHLPKLHLIASGGVSCIEDLFELKRIGCNGVIIGKAIYENRISLQQLSEFMNQNQ